MAPGELIPATEQQTWTRRIRDGDVAAFEAAFHAWYGELCSFVRPQVGSADVAEEIVQETFLRVWRTRLTLDPAQPLRAYLYRAARNTAINQLKRRELESQWLSGAASTTVPRIHAADEELHVHELSNAVQHTLATLPERCRLIFTMSRHQGLSYNEIADALGISIKTVETQMGRALKALRAGLATFLP
jgi:RNA polymerase sigma-70 factor, ECF subfamily